MKKCVVILFLAFFVDAIYAHDSETICVAKNNRIKVQYGEYMEKFVEGKVVAIDDINMLVESNLLGKTRTIVKIDEVAAIAKYDKRQVNLRWMSVGVPLLLFTMAAIVSGNDNAAGAMLDTWANVAPIMVAVDNQRSSYREIDAGYYFVDEDESICFYIKKDKK
jgi:hypothetical protein